MKSHFPSHIFFLTAIIAIQFAFSFPIDSMFARGDSCIFITWKPDSQNTNPSWYIKNGQLCKNADTIYRHCDFLPGITYRSIAYSYGGEDSYKIFLQKVKDHFLIGSHLCHYNYYGDPSPVIAGTDCSGFVSYIWSVPRLSTTGFLNSTSYKRISKSELRPGDAMIKGGSHMVIIADKGEDSTEFLIWESTSVVNGCRERIINLADKYWSDYVPIRNPNLSNVKVLRNYTNQNSKMLHFQFSANSKKLISNIPITGKIDVITISGKKLISIQNKKEMGVAQISLPNFTYNTVIVKVSSYEFGENLFIINPLQEPK